MTTTINAEPRRKFDSLFVLQHLKDAMYRRFEKAGDEFEDNAAQHDFALSMLANHSYNSKASYLPTLKSEEVSRFVVKVEEESQMEIISELANERLDIAEVKAIFEMLKIEGLIEVAPTLLVYPTKEGLALLRTTLRS